MNLKELGIKGKGQKGSIPGRQEARHVLIITQLGLKKKKKKQSLLALESEMMAC